MADFPGLPPSCRAGAEFRGIQLSGTPGLKDAYRQKHTDLDVNRGTGDLFGERSNPTRSQEWARPAAPQQQGRLSAATRSCRMPRADKARNDELYAFRSGGGCSRGPAGPAVRKSQLRPLDAPCDDRRHRPSGHSALWCSPFSLFPASHERSSGTEAHGSLHRSGKSQI